jgi:hypothetical protein
VEPFQGSIDSLSTNPGLRSLRSLALGYPVLPLQGKDIAKPLTTDHSPLITDH